MTDASSLPELGLSTVLARVSASLVSLADLVHGVEHAIGAELGPGTASLSAGNITRLQHLDLVRQTLEDLSILSMALAKDSDGVVNTHIAEKLRLAATKQLLAAQVSPSLSNEPLADTGTVDLF